MEILIVIAVVALLYTLYRKLGKGKKVSAPVTAPLPATPGTACKEYLNNTSSPIEGVSYVDCGGGSVVNKTVDPGQSICAQEGTLIGGGFLTELGNC